MTEEEKLMVSRFKNNVRAVMEKISEYSADGASGGEQAGALLTVGLEPEQGFEVEYNAWYEDEHIPYILKVPGVLHVRRFRAIDGAPSYLTLWDLASPEVRQSAAFEQAAESPWTRRIAHTAIDALLPFTVHWSPLARQLRRNPQPFLSSREGERVKRWRISLRSRVLRCMRRSRAGRSRS